jgi:hypothetical protein
MTDVETEFDVGIEAAGLIARFEASFQSFAPWPICSEM